MEAEVEAPEAPDVPLVQVEGVVELDQPGEGAVHVRLRPDARRTRLLFPDCCGHHLAVLLQIYAQGYLSQLSLRRGVRACA